MASRWFRIKKLGNGTITDPIRPDYVESMGLSYSMAKDPDNTPICVIRASGTTSELDKLANESGVKELSDVPKSTLDRLTGVSRSKSEWNKRHEIR